MSPLAALFAAKHNVLPAMQWELALQRSAGLASLDLIRFSVALVLSALCGALVRPIRSTNGKGGFVVVVGVI